MSKGTPRKFSTEFKIRVLARLERGESVAAVARETGVARQAFRAHGPAGLNRKRGRKPDGGCRLRECGRTRPGPGAHRQARAGDRRQEADLHFFREALRLWNATSRSGGAPTSTRSSNK
jgi:transposase-like protein